MALSSNRLGHKPFTLAMLSSTLTSVTSIYSSIAQLVERMTVNHDVTGSSPVGGAKRQVRFLLICRGLVRRGDPGGIGSDMC